MCYVCFFVTERDILRVGPVCLMISRTDVVGNTGSQGLNLGEVLIPLYIGKRRRRGEGERKEEGWEEKERDGGREEIEKRGRREGYSTCVRNAKIPNMDDEVCLTNLQKHVYCHVE